MLPDPDDRLRKFGQFFKHLGTIGAVATALGFAADAHANWVEQATKNAVKSATFYDVTVEPAGKWMNKTFDQAQHGALNDDSAIGHNINEKWRLLHPDE